MIVFDAVNKVYEPDVRALSEVTFHIDKGEFVFVVGASGSGKSTLVRLLLKELEPTSGKIVVGGRELGRLKRSKVPMLRRNIGCVFQDFKLLPNRSAAENVAYALKVQGENRSSIRKKVPEVLSMVGLAHRLNSLPDELSGGEQQRVSIARAFVNHPPLLVCDEPTGNLDPDTSVGIMQLLYRINQCRHDGADGDPRPGDGRQDAQARDPARRRPAGPRRATRRLQRRMKLRLLVSEAWRSLGANVSTTFAAMMTVLIGMFLLGLLIALGTWTVSWSNHVKSELLVRVDFNTSTNKGGQATHAEENAVARRISINPLVSRVVFVSREQALKEMKKSEPQLADALPFNPLPDSLEVTPKNADDIQQLYTSLVNPLPPGVQKVIDGKVLLEPDPPFARVIEIIFLIAISILLTSAALLIANTIRLSIFSRRREIEVMKLVGATNWFVRGPFMIEGPDLRVRRCAARRRAAHDRQGGCAARHSP